MSGTPRDRPGGDYPDRDLPEGDVEAGEGDYTDQQTPAEQRGEEADPRGPEDRGEYTDSDVVTQHRPSPPAGGYTSRDTDRSSNDHGEEHPHG